MKAHAVIRLDFPSQNQSKIVLEALKPETRTSATYRSRVHIEGKGNNLTISFEARDTSALRAAINSYLRMTSAVIDVIKFIESAEK